MLRINRRAWVESVGKKVLLIRLPGADITFTLWERRINVFVCVHDGQPLLAPKKYEVGEYDLIVQRADA